MSIFIRVSYSIPSSFSIVTIPDVCLYIPIKQLKIVVFPEPFGPSNVVIWFSYKSNETSLTAILSGPNLLTRWLTRTIGFSLEFAVVCDELGLENEWIWWSMFSEHQ